MVNNLKAVTPEKKVRTEFQKCTKPQGPNKDRGVFTKSTYSYILNSKNVKCTQGSIDLKKTINFIGHLLFYYLNNRTNHKGQFQRIPILIQNTNPKVSTYD